MSVPSDGSLATQTGLESSWTGPCPGLACARVATLRVQMLQGAQEFFGAGEALDPLFMKFPKQEYWSGLPFPLPGIFLTQGLNPGILNCRQILYS